MWHDPALGGPQDHEQAGRQQGDDDPGDVSAKLKLAFSLAHDPLVPRARPLLRKRVFSFVDDRRHVGWSAERIVSAIKRLARSAGLPVDSATETSQVLAHRIVTEATEWALSRYQRRSFQR